MGGIIVDSGRALCYRGYARFRQKFYTSQKRRRDWRQAIERKGYEGCMEYAVQTQRIARKFGDLTAVDAIDLAIPKGEIYGFLGPNGAGKTTLVRMLITLLMPTSGSASVAGYDVARETTQVRLRIGAALQEAALDLKQTGRELLRMQGRLYGLSRREIDARMGDLAGLVDIGEAIDRFIHTYSGGMKRRLDLAAALIHNPEVLFLDGADHRGLTQSAARGCGKRCDASTRIWA